jgi:hypothetical protein
MVAFDTGVSSTLSDRKLVIMVLGVVYTCILTDNFMLSAVFLWLFSMWLSGPWLRVIFLPARYR